MPDPQSNLSAQIGRQAYAFRKEQEMGQGYVPSKSIRIAYFKRMLKRLEGEETRAQQLVSCGELTVEGGALTNKLVSKSRKELLSELQALEGNVSTDAGSDIGS